MSKIMSLLLLLYKYIYIFILVGVYKYIPMNSYLELIIFTIVFVYLLAVEFIVIKKKLRVKIDSKKITKNEKVDKTYRIVMELIINIIIFKLFVIGIFQYIVLGIFINIIYIIFSEQTFFDFILFQKVDRRYGESKV